MSCTRLFSHSASPPLACAQQSYYNVNFDDLYTSSDRQIGVYNNLDYRELRI